MLKEMIVLGAMLSAVACSHQEKEADYTAAGVTPAKPVGTSIEAKQVAAEEEAPFVTEFGFRKTSASLTPEARASLAKLYSEARAKGKVEDVRVITWADEEFPSVHTKRLTKQQRELADRRNSEIEKYLKSIDSDTDVKTYSMAERSGVLADLLSTPDARIKKSLEVAGIPNTHTSVKMPSKASKSIVLFILED